MSSTHISRQSPHVEKNNFRRLGYNREPLPTFAEARPHLPEPILPNHLSWERAYWRAWEGAWESLRQPKEGSGFVASYLSASSEEEHLFMWDSAFMTLFGFYGRRAFDFNGLLNNFYGKQDKAGFLCRRIDEVTGENLYAPHDLDSTGPNLFAWVEWESYRVTGNIARLEQVFYPLLAYYEWLRDHRTWQNRLYWATGVSCGMDNQSRIPDSSHYHNHWSWMDVSLQANINLLSLQRIALVLQEQEIHDRLALEQSLLQTAINRHLWQDDTLFYHDVDRNGQPNAVKSIAAYWALLDHGLVSEKQRKGMIDYLHGDGVFKLFHRVPSLAADSGNYTATGDLWCGGVWSPMNYMVLRGLRIAGEHRLAHRIACNHVSIVSQVFDRTGSFWSHYSPETLEAGEGAWAVKPGWTGLTPISILLEDVIGIRADWRQKRVIWNKRLDTEELHGIQNYPLGDEGTADLLSDAEGIYITTDVPFTLILQTADNTTVRSAIAVGTTEIPLV